MAEKKAQKKAPSVDDSQFSQANTRNHSIHLLFGEIDTEVAAVVCQWILESNLNPNEEEKPGALTMMINSVGGDLHAAFAIIECMRGSPIPIHTVAMGNICSAGLMIFMNGTKGFRTITPTCTIMSHNYSTGITGNHHELLAIQKELNFTHQRILDLYKRCTGMPEKLILEKLIGNQDTYLTPTEALALKLGDRISGV
jgi:ATP-dependent protease ClpP protease subunit